MATTAAHTAAPAHRQQAHRPLSRIVPAIPHRLARAAPPAARPTTPERASKGAAPEPTPQQQPEPEPQAEDKKDAAVVDTPLTPDSRISGVDKGETDASAQVQFPPTPQEESAVDSTEEQSASQAGPTIQAASASRESAEGQVNGHGKKIDTEAATAHLESAPAANRARRKLTIPAQLPPAFVPSSKPHTPAPSAEISDAPKVPYHRHQLSAGAVVFKSANGSPATPATPQEFDHDAHHHNEQLGSQPPPGFVPLQYIDGGPASFQHLSEAGASWVHPAHRIAAPDHVYGNGTEYGSPRYVDGMNAQPDSQDNRHPAGDTTLATNGSATPHSQSPSKTQFGRLQPASDYSEEHRGPQYHNGTSHPVEPVDHSPFELAAYLSTQFGNPDFADFVLQIRSPESALVSIPVHGIVVSRSPVIEAAVRRSPAPSHRSPNARRLIDVMTLDPHITRESLEEAVKVLYGSPLLLPQNIFFGLGPYAYEADARSSDARRRMQQVISYIAAAKALQIGSMQARGVEISRMLLRWDTVDQLLSYGLQVGSARKEMDPEDVLGPTLVHCVVEFIAYTFPVDFKLHTIAPEMHEVPRLPIVLESRPPMHNPRLSKIRFGDAPTGDNASHSPVDKILSTLLFSLPAPLLDLLFNHPAIANQIGWTGAMKLLGDVVAERENRRLKALRGQLKSAQDGTVPAALLDNMYTEEQLEQYPAHPSGYRLVTKRSVAGG